VYNLQHGRSGFLNCLRAAYIANDIPRLAAEYERAFRRPVLAVPLRALELAYPLRSLLRIAVQLEQRIADEGLPRASRWLLDTYLPGWRCTMPEATLRQLDAHPTLIYGNHPSLLTPFLVTACVNRPDLRIVSSSHVHHLLPSYAPYSLPVEIPRGSLREDYSRGGLQVALGRRLIKTVHSMPSPDEIRTRNRGTLATGAAHVATGGSLLMAPEGPSARRRPWQTGIGFLVQQILGQTPPRPVYALAYWEQHTSDRRAFAEVHRNLLARIRRRLVYRHAPGIAFSELYPLAELAGGCSDPRALTARLRAHYAQTFPMYERS